MKEKLKEFRLSKYLTQKEAAILCHVDISNYGPAESMGNTRTKAFYQILRQTFEKFDSKEEALEFARNVI